MLPQAKTYGFSWNLGRQWDIRGGRSSKVWGLPFTATGTFSPDFPDWKRDEQQVELAFLCFYLVITRGGEHP